MGRAEINGKTIEFSEGTTILTAARSIGVDIPTLCHDDRIKPVAACRMCLVAVQGSAQSIASCKTLLSDGMSVETHSAELEDARRWNLRMLAKDYPVASFEKFPEKPLHQLATQYGLTPADFSRSNGLAVDDSHTYIRVDMSRCIKCFACVRICDEVQGQFV